MTPRERLVTGPPGIGAADALALLHRHRIEKLPLADADGRVAGMVTLRDLEQESRYPHATRDGEGRLRVAAAIGVRGGYLERAEALLAADADALVLDIAHGHADSALEAVRELKRALPAGRGDRRQRRHGRGRARPCGGGRGRDQGRHRARLRLHDAAGRGRRRAAALGGAGVRAGRARGRACR